MANRRARLFAGAMFPFVIPELGCRNPTQKILWLMDRAKELEILAVKKGRN